MIALLRGTVAGRRTDHVVLDVAGVGYKVGVSAETLSHVPAVGKSTTLLTHMVVREDAIQLFGFATEEERDLFLLLLGVQQVGPKLALDVLSGGTPRELAAAIAAEDHRRFQAVKGVGKRTAERIVVELREKVMGIAPDPAGDIAAVRAPGGGEDAFRLAREALVELGLPLLEAERMLKQASGETPEELVADALRASRS